MPWLQPGGAELTETLEELTESGVDSEFHQESRYKCDQKILTQSKEETCKRCTGALLDFEELENFVFDVCVGFVLCKFVSRLIL